MNSMVVGGYINVDATNLKGGYREPCIVTVPILDHKDGHYVKPNMVALKCSNYKKNVDFNVHVKLLNFIVKVNAKTSEEYIINAFSYMLRNITSH
jgi:hypothetical protein